MTQRRMILAIDTSLGTSVAVVDGDTVVFREHAADARRHAEHLGGWSRSLARSVMDRSFCPVAVVPRSERSRSRSGSRGVGSLVRG